MTPRLLRPAEWPTKLVGTDLEAIHPSLPGNACVIVVEDEQQAVVGCWVALQYWHVEGLWVREDHRKRGAVLRRLKVAMAVLLNNFGVKRVMTAALTDDVRALIHEANGTKLPGDHYVVPVGGA